MIKIISLMLMQVFLLTGIACPDTLRVPMMYETGIANQRELLMQKDDRGEAALNLNVLNSMLRDVSKALEKKGLMVTPIIMGSTKYLADEKGLVKFSAIEDIDIALATNAGTPGTYQDAFVKELMDRLISLSKEAGVIFSVSITLQPPRIWIEAGGATRRISTPVGGPDLAELFIRTMLQHPTRDSEDYNKRSKRALAILYYAGTFFHAEDRGWFSGFRTLYLNSYQNSLGSAEKVMSVIEQQALEVRKQYETLEESHNAEKPSEFKEHVRKKIGAPDYKGKESIGRREVVKGMLGALAEPEVLNNEFGNWSADLIESKLNSIKEKASRVLGSYLPGLATDDDAILGIVFHPIVFASLCEMMEISGKYRSDPYYEEVKERLDVEITMLLETGNIDIVRIIKGLEKIQNIGGFLNAIKKVHGELLRFIQWDLRNRFKDKTSFELIRSSSEAGEFSTSYRFPENTHFTEDPFHILANFDYGDFSVNAIGVVNVPFDRIKTTWWIMKDLGIPGAKLEYEYLISAGRLKLLKVFKNNGKSGVAGWKAFQKQYISPAKKMEANTDVFRAPLEATRTGI